MCRSGACPEARGILRPCCACGQRQCRSSAAEQQGPQGEASPCHHAAVRVRMGAPPRALPQEACTRLGRIPQRRTRVPISAQDLRVGLVPRCPADHSYQQALRPGRRPTQIRRLGLVCARPLTAQRRLLLCQARVGCCCSCCSCQHPQHQPQHHVVCVRCRGSSALPPRLCLECRLVGRGRGPPLAWAAPRRA